MIIEWFLIQTTNRLPNVRYLSKDNLTTWWTANEKRSALKQCQISLYLNEVTYNSHCPPVLFGKARLGKGSFRIEVPTLVQLIRGEQT